MIKIKKILINNIYTPERQLTKNEKQSVVARWGDGKDYIFFERKDIGTPEFQQYEDAIRIEPSPIDLIIAEYDLHEENGKRLHKEIRASLVLRLKAKELTLQNVLAIEDRLSNVANNVRVGDWLTARAKLEAAQTNAVFTEQLKSEILGKINTYITDNYK